MATGPRPHHWPHTQLTCSWLSQSITSKSQMHQRQVYDFIHCKTHGLQEAWRHSQWSADPSPLCSSGPGFIRAAPPSRSLQCQGPTSWDPQAQGLSGCSEGRSEELRHILHPAPTWLLRKSGPNIRAACHPPLVLTWVLLFRVGRGCPQVLNPQAGKAGLAPAGDWAPWGWCHVQRPQGSLGCPVPGAARSRTGCTQDTDRCM